MSIYRARPVYVAADISTNKFFSYQAKLTFEPNKVTILNIHNYNTGSDTGIFVLTSDLFMNDVNFGATFVESQKAFAPVPHQITDPINGRTFTFNVFEANGGTNASGKIAVMLLFEKC